MGTSSTRSNEAPHGATERPEVKKERPPARCQGAMSQQGYGAHGNESYPQHMVQLVGYRSPRALAAAQAEAVERLRLKHSLDQAAE
ncbi:MAG: hypothetical protein JWQ94_3312 [Tardiphaga sp.]|nr:hypothetical protein [Tardiphaga sp.]